QIQASDFARVELIVLDAGVRTASAPPSASRSKLGTLAATLRDERRRRRLLFSLYERWDRRHVGETADPLAPVGWTARLAGTPAFQVIPETKRFVHRFPGDALKRIRAADLDVIPRFRFHLPPPPP